MNIRFNVLHQRLIRCDSSALTEGSKNYLNCSFTFSEDWNTLEKAALFLKQGDTVPYPALISDNACKIPDAVCQTGGRWEMALIGAGGDVINKLVNGMSDLKNANIVITTNSCCLRFGETVSVNTINEDESKENPFADVLAKITALSDSYESKQNKTDDALTTEDKTVVGAINETHSKAWDAMSAAETALSNTSVNEMLMGSLDNLTTQEKSTIVGAINEINSNKQAKDFVITGTVTGNLGTGGIDVSDISCTYEEARAAFDGGQNVKCLFYAPELSTYTEFRYKAHSDFMIMFECMWDDYNYLPVFMANDTWDWGYSTPYRGDYVETEAMYNVAPIKVRGTIDSNNTLTLNRAQHYGRIFENAEDIQDWIVLYLNQVPIIFYVFVEEQGRFMNCYVENIIGKRNSVDTTAEVWSYDAMSFSGHIGNTVYHLDCIKVRDDYTGSFAWQWSVYTAELVAKTEIETQIGDINTALETALNGGAS